MPNNKCANIPEWFALLVNIVGHVGPLAEKHGSGMRSFDMRCTSYNPGVSGKYKTNDFILRLLLRYCEMLGGLRNAACWDAGAHNWTTDWGYKMGHDEKPAVLITDSIVRGHITNLHCLY